MKNNDVREVIKSSRLRCWAIADKLGIGESTLCRRLRHELTSIEKQKIYHAIEELKNEGGDEDGTK